MANAYLYCGEQYDPDLGLYYNRARYLNVDSGRFWQRDVFEGNPLIPETFHKYVYGHSDPVSNIDPSGLCIPTLNGIIVHVRIGSDFTQNNPLRLSGSSITTIHQMVMTQGERALFRLAVMPDLVDTQTHEVYEIKPVWQMYDGAWQLQIYLWLLNFLDPARGTPQFVPWRPGTTYDAGHLSPIVGFPYTCENYVRRTSFGVITYVPIPSNTTLGVGGAALLYQIISKAADAQMKSIIGGIGMRPSYAY